MNVSYKFRIYPNREQENLIQKTFGCVRYVFNYYLADRIEKYKSNGECVGYYKQAHDLALMKKEKDWLREPDKCALQNTLMDLDKAYKNFFMSQCSSSCFRYPKFKSKKRCKKSYRTNSNISVYENSVKLPKVGFVKCKVSRMVVGRIISATVSQSKSGKYFISITCGDVDLENPIKTNRSVGVDLGIKSLATTSDGIKYKNNKYLESSQKEIVRLQRQLSRKTRGSKRYEAARVRLAKKYEKVSNQRKDSLNKLTTFLILNYDNVFIENLNVSGMSSNHRLASCVRDASFYEFRRQLEYKANFYGKNVVAIDRFYPSSQICSCCGERWSGTKDLSVRYWTCNFCGANHDRDVNAAKNILAEGLRII